MFSLPLLQVDLDKKSLAKVRKLHPAQYEKIIETKSGLCRFYSNFESVNVFEFVTQHIELPDNCIFLHKVNDSWYVLIIEHGAVNQQKSVTFNELFTSFGYELTQTENIYCPKDDASSDYFKSYRDKITHIEPLDFSLCNEQYSLPKNKNAQKNKIIASIVIITALIAVIASLLYEPKKEVVVNVDPLAQYKQHFFSSISASDAFDVAFRATAYGLLLPQDWVFANTQLSNSDILLNYETSPNGSMNKTMKAFTTLHPSIKDAWSEQEQTFNWPLKHPTQLDIPSLDQNIYWLRDELTNIGFNVTQKKQPSINQVNRYQLTATKANANFIELKTLATLTKTHPIYISELKIQNGITIPLVSINAQMTLEGKFND